MRSHICCFSLALVFAACGGDGDDATDTDTDTTDTDTVDTDTTDTTDTDTTDPFVPVLLEVGTEHYGYTIEEWGVRWWKWALELQGDNPLVDPTGAFCANGQIGDVWFLAGTTGGSATRSCTIPAGKALLFPIVNTVVDNSFVPDPTSPYWRDEATLVQAVDDAMALTHDMALDIDGITWTNAELLETYAGATVFAYTLPAEPNFYTACCSASIVGTVDPAVTGGFWAMLDPLPPGPHEITFTGIGYYGLYEVAVDMTYHLTVE
jgi:hypothetical protein